MTIGEKIKTIRVENHLSQETFGELFNVTRQAVSNWENNKNYPDMTVLIDISEKYQIPLDEFLKEDEAFINETDDNKHKVSRLRKAVKIFAVIITALLLVMVGFLVWLHVAFQPTDDGKRILTETDMRAVVNLQNSRPSRAITRTFDADKYDGFSESKKQAIAEETKGRLEGDVPSIILDNENTVAIQIQDLDYNDIDDIKIQKITACTYNIVTEKPASGELPSFMKDGKIIVDIGHMPGEMSGDDWSFCTMELRYNVDKHDYVTVVSIGVFLHDFKWN